MANSARSTSHGGFAFSRALRDLMDELKQTSFICSYATTVACPKLRVNCRQLWTGHKRAVDPAEPTRACRIAESEADLWTAAAECLGCR